MGITPHRLKTTLQETPYNEFETCLEFFDRHSGIYETHFTPTELYKEVELSRIFNGTLICSPKNRNKLLYSMLKFGYKRTVCDCCNITPKRRDLDGTYPFVLTFKDMKKPKDFSLDNLEIVCYNCSYTKMSDYAYSMKGVKKLRKSGMKLIEKLDTQWEAIDYNLDTKSLTEMEIDYKKQWEHTNSIIKANPSVNKLLDKFAKVLNDD